MLTYLPTVVMSVPNAPVTNLVGRITSSCSIDPSVRQHIRQTLSQSAGESHAGRGRGSWLLALGSPLLTSTATTVWCCLLVSTRAVLVLLMLLSMVMTSQACTRRFPELDGTVPTGMAPQQAGRQTSRATQPTASHYNDRLEEE